MKIQNLKSLMGQRKYRLQPVLDLRNKAQEDAARLVAMRRKQLVLAEAELLRRERALAECQQRQFEAQGKMFDAATGGIESHHLLEHRTHISDLKRIELELIAEVEQQRAALSRAEIDLEKAIIALLEASKQAQMIEKHHETWDQRIRRDEQRREQKISDEISAAIHERRRER